MVQQSQLQITIEGSAFRVRRGFDEFWNSYERGLWEPETQAVFRRFIDIEHSYADIGAWIGPTLLLGSQLAKRAYGVEPDPIAYAELTENMESNRPLTNNVQLFNICIVPVSGKVSFGSRGGGGDSTSSLLLTAEKTVWTVDGVSYQEWIEQNDINDCGFVKIDIEGGEYKVLPSMTTYLRKHRPTLLLSLHPGFLGDQELRSVKAKLKRHILRLKNTIRILSALRFYSYWYDPWDRLSNSGMGSLRSHLFRRLTKSGWKPAILLLACRDSLRGSFSSLVLTDQKW